MQTYWRDSHPTKHTVCVHSFNIPFIPSLNRRFIIHRGGIGRCVYVFWVLAIPNRFVHFVCSVIQAVELLTAGPVLSTKLQLNQKKLSDTTLDKFIWNFSGLAQTRSGLIWSQQQKTMESVAFKLSSLYGRSKCLADCLHLLQESQRKHYQHMQIKGHTHKNICTRNLHSYLGRSIYAGVSLTHALKNWWIHAVRMKRTLCPMETSTYSQASIQKDDTQHTHDWKIIGFMNGESRGERPIGRDRERQWTERRKKKNEKTRIQKLIFRCR